ncbi:MAG TPA: CPBP family intramembrane glutamic endopeptidase [Steroidobacteraceae bacterium]|jgi:membrane protease YdiL (CAAX protease family)|nr:CPBP family intramembrane glutamic endopeptidase [Steroidobacteraceae bacterium]
MRALSWFLGLMAVALAAIAAFSWPAWLLLHPHFDFPFHRIGERVGMLALLLGFVAVARRLKLADRASLGYGVPRREFVREMALGLILGVVTMLALVGLMSTLGLLDWSLAATFSVGTLAKLIALRAVSGFAVAFIEETFLRGAMHSAIERESGTTAAVLCTALLYAATHFFASFHIPPEQVSAHSGLTLLAGTLQRFAHPAAIADAFLALCAVGVVLGVVRATTGNIAACIGLHAGWVWVMLTMHELTRPLPGAPLAFLLSRFDGFVGWLVFAWTVLLTVPLWRFYSRRARRVAPA